LQTFFITFAAEEMLRKLAKCSKDSVYAPKKKMELNKQWERAFFAFTIDYRGCYKVPQIVMPLKVNLEQKIWL
jgi:hypothetical protein